MPAPSDTPVRLALRRAALLSLALALVVSAILALGALTTDGRLLVDRLREDARALPLLGGLGLLAAALPLTAMRWRTLLGPETRPQAGPGLLTGLLCAGFLLNAALPGVLGDLLAVSALKRKAGTSMAEGFGALTVGRVFGMGAAALLAGASGLLLGDRLPAEWATSLHVAAGLLVLAALSVTALVLWPRLPRRVVLAALEAVRSRAAPPLAARIARVQQPVGRILTDLTRAATLGPARLLAAFGWSLAVHASSAAGVALVAAGLGVAMAPAAVTFAYTGTVTGSLLLFLLPGSHTGFDVLLTALLGLVGGVPLAEGVAITGLLRLGQTAVTLLGTLALVVAFRAWLPEVLPGRAATSEP